MRKKVLTPALVPAVDTWAEQPEANLLRDLQDKLRAVADVDARRPVSSEEWAQAIKGVNVVAGPPGVNEDFLETADRLEMLQLFGIGYDRIDLPACTRKRVVVCNVAEIYSESVAQHAWALILDLTKHVARADRHTRAGTWRREDWMGVQLWGKTLGVIGLGSIGGRIALKGRLAFGMRVLAYDPYVLQERAQLYGAELADLDSVLQQSDIVSLSMTLTPETRHIIGKKELSKMKKSAFLINTCRGAVIDEKALIEHLLNGGMQGAGLDVFETEPISKDSPLLEMDNVVLTPHIASATEEAVEETYRAAIANIVRYLEGTRPHWIINPEAYKGQIFEV